MPVSVQWDNDEKTILVWLFQGKWTWDEYYNLRDETNQAIAAEGHTVHLIVDMRNCSMLPSGALSHARTAVSQNLTNLGITVFVGLNPVLRSFYAMFSKLYNRLLTDNQLDMLMVATLEEAYAVIEKANKQDKVSNGAP